MVDYYPNPLDSHVVDSFGVKRMRKHTQRRVVDYTSTVVKYIQARTWQRDTIQPTSFVAKFVLASLNKKRCSINSVLWTPSGRRLITGSHSGEFTLWNGQSFNFEAHDQPIRSMIWSHRCEEEQSLTGHGWDVKSVDWHPTKSLLVSGGRDQLVKLWDARTGKELCSLHGHKNMVLSVKWNQNGNWLLTASKDQIIKLYDIRTMKELESFRGHKKDVTSLAWHPLHEKYFVSGSLDGFICHCIVGHENPQIEIPNAHDKSVWDLAWHSIGYLLCSGSNDHTTKFWCRNRPADHPRDVLPIQNQGYNEQGFGSRMPDNFQPSESPGAFVTRNQGTIPGLGIAMPLPAGPLPHNNQQQ